MTWDSRNGIPPGNSQHYGSRPGDSPSREASGGILPKKEQKTDTLPDVFVYTERNFVVLVGEFD